MDRGRNGRLTQVAIGLIGWLLLIGTGTTACRSSHSTPTPTQPLVTPSLTPTAEVAASPSPPSPTATPTPEPVIYIVQQGDTLGAIAQEYGVTVDALVEANNLEDPNRLSIGQRLIIPLTPTEAPSTSEPSTPGPSTPASATATPLSTPTTPALPLPPTLTPSGPPLLEIEQVIGAGDVQSEVVIVRNSGGAVDLTGWTLRDTEGNTFTFPAVTLFQDAPIRVHSSAGESSPLDLYWGRETPAWNPGELIVLADADANAVHTFVVP